MWRCEGSAFGLDDHSKLGDALGLDSTTMKTPLLLPALAVVALLGCDPTTPVNVHSDAGPSCACDANMAADTTLPPDAVALVDAPIATDTAFSNEPSHDAARDTPGTCNEATTALQAAAVDVLFLSESDRVIEVRVFAGEGAAAPTEASVVALARLPESAASSTRPVENFSQAFEPNLGAPKSAPATLSAAIEASLSDLIYVTIVDPALGAEVHVILAGRTTCGDLIFLRSVSIET